MIVRSWLYVPGDQPERFAKAVAKGTDAVVLDLEDAVAPARKLLAREEVARWVRDGDHGRVQVWVRVNQGAAGLEDLEAVLAPGLHGVCLPKVDARHEVDTVDQVLTRGETALGLPAGQVRVVPLIESAVGLENIRSITRGPRVCQLQVGEVDLAGDLGLSGDVDLHLAAIRSSILVASIAAGIDAPVGPVSTEFKDLEAFRRSSETVKAQGFVGRACIHPAQVAIVNEMFTPTSDEVARATDLLERLDEALREGSGVALDAQGRMIDEASARSARRVLQLAGAGQEN